MRPPMRSRAVGSRPAMRPRWMTRGSCSSSIAGRTCTSRAARTYPAEVENVLYQLPEVAEAAIIGVPDDKWGEVGLAVIALKPGAELDRKTLVEYCVTRLAKFKVPNDMAIVEALPRNATGKVLKRELRTQFVEADAPKI